MPESPAYERDPAATPEIHLAECWADVTKALALYPNSNERVQSKLTELIAAAEAVLDAARGVVGADLERGVGILFQDDHVFVGSMEHTFEPGSSLSWLRSRLDRSALAGIEVLPSVTAESFTAFTRKLLDNYLYKGSERTFEALWTELYEGLVLIDRRFEGSFGGLASMGKFAGGHGGVAGRDARHFITGLLMHPKVRKRIAQISELGTKDEETSEASTLLRDVLEDVPADALKSRDVLIDWVCGRLDDLVGRVGGSGTGAPVTPGEGERFASLLREVSLKHFAREGPNLDRIKAGTIVETKPGGGRARDAEITDDVESLSTEVRQLPAELAMRLGADDPVAVPEQVAVILHYAVHLQRPEELPGQQRLLSQLLADPGPAELAVVRKYVQLEGDSEAATQSTSAVIRVLADAGRTPLLRQCGALSVDFVVETFPLHLGRFLSAVDLQLDRDRAELDEVLTRVGPQGVLNAASKLMPAIERLDREDVQRLLEEPKACRLALVRLLLQRGEKPAVAAAAEFVRELDPHEAEAFLLHTIRPLALLTPEYLMGLIDVHLGRATSFALRAPVSEVLCRHIIAVGDADPLDRARMESIRLLARYPSSRGEQMLKTLRRFSLGFLRRGEPPPVRRLARSLLKSWKAA